MADQDRGNWEDYIWRIKVKGKPEAINRFAAELTSVGNQFDGHSGDAAEIAKTTKPKGETGWHGPAGSAFRKYVDVKLTDPLADRHKAIGPVTKALEKAAEALAKAQKAMPMPVIGRQDSRANGQHDAGADANGYIGEDFDYKAAAYRIWEPDLTLHLGWYPPVQAQEIVVEPTKDHGVAKTRIAQWYEMGQKAAHEVELQLIVDYTAIKNDLIIEPYKAEKPKDDKDKDGDTGGGKPTTDPGGKKPDTTTPKVETPKTEPDTKPKTDPNADPGQKPGDKGGQDPKGEDPKGQDPKDQDPGGQDPQDPGKTDPYKPDPYDPDPYEPDPYDPGSYDPSTGLASAGGGGGGGVGGGLGAGTGGPGVATGVAAPQQQPGMGPIGAGAGAASRMAPMGGMGGMGGGHGNSDSGGHETWLTEDEDAWHGEDNTAPPVIGM
ncbi:hypothetical protein Afil01_66040 [Actinorhabdospora filicis]|uniref:Uncharacterized protein n=1 Tax=Actinorhabdospora filicis TaxID=1785913 RepID=A0A9W6STZ5_9ACTN|nr:hypothetical protein [Actinorhabdospora filicis]GLZ81797.1 hypothetical protein Afil01_66040 [Actinorhabdospora filicis]